MLDPDLSQSGSTTLVLYPNQDPLWIRFAFNPETDPAFLLNENPNPSEKKLSEQFFLNIEFNQK
jgi:hypothetical protein